MKKSELRKLKRDAHHLKAELHLGKEGFSKLWLKSLRQAFQTKELLKVKILENCPEDRDMIKKRLKGITNMTHVQTIGNVVTLFQKKRKG